MDNKDITFINKSFRYLIVGALVMVTAAVVTAFIFWYFIKTINSFENQSSGNYKEHYAFVVDEKDGEFWNQVYEAAREQAQSKNIYLENFNDSMGGNYTGAGLLRVAINSSVDGIMYAGNATDEVVSLINEAVKSGICVVVMDNDVEPSLRQCFVGTSNYELGQMYANQIIEMVGEDKVKDTEVAILVSGDMSEGAANLITLAIEDSLVEYIGDGNVPQIEIIRINATDTFSAEEDIRNLFLSEKGIPDVMICLAGSYTQCVYQAVVDYNHVGEVNIIGYFTNEDILEAIEKRIIYSTISVDIAEMGKSAVSAIEEYNDIGYTNSYMPVGMSVVDEKEANKMLDELKALEESE